MFVAAGAQASKRIGIPGEEEDRQEEGGEEEDGEKETDQPHKIVLWRRLNLLHRTHRLQGAEMKLVTAEQMRAIDRDAIDRVGIPGPELMENAGKGIADEILSDHIEDPSATRVVVFCGKGNNGGDGFVVAEDDVVAQTRAGKQVLNVRGDTRPAVCRPVEVDHVAAVGENQVDVGAEREKARKAETARKN